MLNKRFCFDCYSNRAWCYSKLELHKHVVKDCDKAIALNPSTLQAYLYKGAKPWADISYSFVIRGINEVLCWCT